MLNNKQNLTIAGIIIWITPLALSASAVNQDCGAVTLSPVQIQFEETASAARLSLKSSGIELNLADIYRYSPVSLRLEGEIPPAESGIPSLPTVVRFILMPPTGGVSVRLTGLETRVISDINLKINDQLNSDIKDHSEGAAEIDFDVERNEFWPPQPVRLGRPAILRGYRILPVVFYPLRWNPVTHELEVASHMDIELDYNSAENQINEVVNPHRPRPSEAAYQLVCSLVLNPPEPPRDLGLRNGSIVYIIGAWDNIQQELQPLLEWRRRMGWSAEIIRVGQSNSTAAVKNAILQAYNEWDVPPEFIVLCGDTDDAFPIAFYDERRGANYPYETDHHYAELEGDDILPEAAVGRLTFNTVNMLRDIVNKTIAYESNPFIGVNQARGWQRRGVVAATDAQSGTSSIDVCRWVKDLVQRNGYTNVAELYWTPQNPQPNARQFIMNNIDAGASIFLYRGWANMSGFGHADVDQLRNGRMLPFVMLATCNTGDYGEHITSPFYYTERFLYLRSGGAIGAVGTSGATHTAYNNLIAAGTLLGLFEENIVNQGWALMRGKLDLYRNYAAYNDIAHHENNGLLGWVCETYIFNLMGDPAVDLYTDIPKTIQVDHPASLRAGETRFQAAVSDPEADAALPHTRVCLYKPGVFSKTLLTDEDGLAVFTLDPDWTAQGVIQLTVTGHNLMPYLRDLQIQQAAQFIGAADWTIDDDNNGDSRGNDNDIANPTERLELNLSLANLGSQAVQGALNAALTPDSPHLSMVQNAVRLDAAPAPGRSTLIEFVVDIEGGFPNGREAVFTLTVTSGQNTWLSSVMVPVVGPQLEFASLQWVNDPLEPGSVADCYIRIRNTGGQASPDLQARLISLTPTVSVPISAGTWGWVGLNSERRCQNPFRLAANIFQIVGSAAHLALVLTGANGFIDTAWVDLTVGQPQPNQPFGPDRYGYICIDNTDRDWFSAPTYNWIEIDPHYRGRGTDTRLQDTAEEEDASVLVDLPFVFRYYGEEFDRITVCSNGWLTLGDRHFMISGRNRRLGGGEIMPAMLCPFWDDLLTTNQGGIYTWFDEERHLFVIEWSRMRRLGPQGVNEASETFEVILYDPDFYPSFTGDGDIVFQYMDVADERSCFQEWDTPYATVGIVNPDQNDGLEYTYWGVLHPGAAPLADNRAIKFSTAVLTAIGGIHGRVIDAETEEPLAGAAVFTQHGFLALTDEAGNYRIENAAAGIPFSITATCPGYNDSTLVDLEIDEDEDAEINFALLHPEFRTSQNELRLRLPVNGEGEVNFALLNEGNGPLLWRAEKHNPAEVDAEPWDLRYNLFAGRIVQDSRINGVVYHDNHYYISGGNNGDPQMYVFDREGNLVREYDQLGTADYGMNDLAWDGQLIWGSGERAIYGFTPEGELVTHWDGPINPCNNLAYDPDRDVLWISGITTDIYPCTREGGIGRPWARRGFRIYGLAYWPEDPDGYNLYIFHSPANNEEWLHKMNTRTGDTMFVRILQPQGGGRPAGAEVSNEFDIYSWTLLTIANNGADDRMDVWQLAARRDWMNLEPLTGTVNAGESQDLTLSVNGQGFPPVDLEGEIVFTHNAVGGQFVLPLTVMIREGPELREMHLPMHNGWNMISLNVTPQPEMFREGEPRGPDVVLMLNQLRLNEQMHNVLIFKDENGRFYVPEFGFCSIPFWNLTEGYQVSLRQNAEAVWLGEPLAADAEIPLNANWNIIAYYPTYELSAAAPRFYVLSPIIDQVEMAKNEQGQFLIPAYQFSNMGPWHPGAGYQVKMRQAAVLHYPAEEEGLAFISVGQASQPVYKVGQASPPAVPRTGAETCPPVRWVSPSSTGSNLSLLITGFSGVKASAGDLVGAFMGDGSLVGCGTVDGDSRCGLAVWGRDDQSDSKSGLNPGEAFSLKLWRGCDDSPMDLILSGCHSREGGNPGDFSSSNGLIYEKDGFIALEVTGLEPVPREFYLTPAYPNPFNGMLRLEYSLPEAGKVRIAAYDLTGRCLAYMVDEYKTAGRHQAVWKAEELPSGVYVLRMECGDFHSQQKVTLLR